MNHHKTFILCILDGWGYSEKTEYNAISQANTPNFDFMLKTCPHSWLETSGLAVGLPERQFGNSEVGHMTIGAGRQLLQDLVRINTAIAQGELEENQHLKDLIKSCKSCNKACHLIGLISDGGVHAHLDHIIALSKILQKEGIELLVHAITDGRDAPPQSALQYLRILKQYKVNIATISGRYYAMDRDNRWERIELFYQAIVEAKGLSFKAGEEEEFIYENYQANIYDEFIIPAAAHGYRGIKEGDSIIIANFRADRVRQILKALLDKDFSHFPSRKLDLATFVGMTHYADEFNSQVKTLFPEQVISNTLGEIISRLDKKQLRLAETEKYAHITYFLNGGQEKLFSGEERVLIDSPKLSTYDLIPEMSAYQLTRALVEKTKEQKFDFICVNFANADMVGHTGNMEAAKRACEVIDECLGQLLALRPSYNIEMLITADHGNAEQLLDPTTGYPHTAHTLNKVPIIYVGQQELSLRPGGLADVAPTLLDLMRIAKPQEMTGASLAVRTFS